MTELQEIDVRIESDGSVRIEVRGVKGKKCTKITQGLEELLGGKAVDREYSDEYYEEEQEVFERGHVRQKSDL